LLWGIIKFTKLAKFYVDVCQLSDSLEVMRASLENHITKRKQAEEALRESEIKYCALVEQLPAACYRAAML